MEVPLCVQIKFLNNRLLLPVSCLDTIVDNSDPGNKTHSSNLNETEMEETDKDPIAKGTFDDETEDAHYYTPQEISPAPRIIKQRKRTAQKSVVLTATPYKEQLEQKKKGKKTNKFISELSEPQPGLSGLGKKKSQNKETGVIVVEANVEDWYCFLCQETRLEVAVRSGCMKPAREPNLAPTKIICVIIVTKS
ncbi:hypothetical protein Zmor_014982 [Zophobas morio]|uniref:Uncharacterized protein n=1 Tax=Zophobas morio TaxID=2755281 RepID=A0AA38IDH2_9CUCU|nr:hypothetical protein Zmor_014982 [Zophobas morio]